MVKVQIGLLHKMNFNLSDHYFSFVRFVRSPLVKEREKRTKWNERKNEGNKKNEEGKQEMRRG